MMARFGWCAVSLAVGVGAVETCCGCTSDVVAVSRVDRSRFSIMSGGFYGPYPAEKAGEIAAAFKACGFDVPTCIRAADTRMLDAMCTNGVGAIVNRAVPYWFGGDGSKAGKMHELHPRAEYEKALAAPLAHPAIVGYDLVDEPNALDFPYIGEIVALIQSARPEMFIWVNLYPNYALADTNTGNQKASQLGTPSYREYIDAYCRNVPLDYISYDHYTFYDDPEMTRLKSSRYYGNMKVVADACRRTDRSFWFIAQACSRKSSAPKFLSQNNLRFQAYSSLAFGCECISWANFLQGWWTNNLYRADGVRTEMYEKVRLMNKEIRRFEPSFWPYRSFQTVLVGFDADRTELAKYDIKPACDYSDGYFRRIRATDGSRLVVGGMVPKKRSNHARAALVFGADDIADTERSTHTVNFSAYGPVRAVGPNGNVVLNRLGENDYSLSLKDNDCVLLVVDKP